MKKNAKTRLWFRAAQEEMLVVFEPLGDEFPIRPGNDIYLELPAEDVEVLEIFVWKTGVSVSLPFPGNNTVLDHNGEVITHLWQI